MVNIICNVSKCVLYTYKNRFIISINPMASLIIPSYIGILPLSLILILICILFFKNSSIYPLQSLLNPQRDGPVYPERLTNHPCRFSGELSSLTAVHNILSYHFLICPLFFSSLRHLLIKNK